jgi:hypothetical protein
MKAKPCPSSEALLEIERLVRDAPFAKVRELRLWRGQYEVLRDAVNWDGWEVTEDGEFVMIRRVG